MGLLRRFLVVLWSIIYLVIPITEFSYGSTYSSNDAACQSVSLVTPCLIGVGITEGILLFAILLIVFFHYSNTGTTEHITTTTTIYPDGKTSSKDSSYTCRGLAYAFAFITVLVVAGFFFALHQVFAVQSTTQFTNSTLSTYCNQQLYQAAFGLIIVSYIVGFLLLIFGIVVYKMES
jgi:hypothetical protein